MNEEKQLWPNSISKCSQLIDIEAVSGNEGPVPDYIREKMKPFVDVISVDKMGDLICHKDENHL